jgi:hypothetical protein
MQSLVDHAWESWSPEHLVAPYATPMAIGVSSVAGPWTSGMAGGHVHMKIWNFQCLPVSLDSIVVTCRIWSSLLRKTADLSTFHGGKNCLKMLAAMGR